ncbi:nickel pincer cofactor biosynthesis protein LarC [Desertibacillus haloalkaliphilus]|uniref:nickel pincer cofactor biosynthesis protein LarC n=1 Tax=Desertibacillus haloalkaliphilus TaxID=1328930 RepID=UPI001C25E25E|nr:nickel pincer cofactor biosynthesis protein LarC [Desertibacillus haloalkaliphilus]MBU8906336.1 nickel pincer cofactor biosynthesis protein LarC [Desertibacillus haloalkaliphilus]
MKTLYTDCFSGISGDMFIGALIDAGANPNHLVEELKKLNISDEYKLKWTSVVKNGISSTKFDVVLLNEEHQHHHSHDDHTHAHEEHHHYRGHHHHRSYADIKQLIEAADLSEEVKKIALGIFRKIGEAEGHIHGVALEDVHFHEVGAVDSIIDIVGTAILLDQLKIDKIQSSAVPVGSGKIRIDHGIYPVPAPATLEILRGVPIASSEVEAELTTPTGAAFIAALAQEFSTLPAMQVQSIGYGAGTKTFPNQPNVLRVIIGNEYR